MDIVGKVFNPRRACARVTVCSCPVCVCVYLSVTTLAASMPAYICNQRYSRVLSGFS